MVGNRHQTSLLQHLKLKQIIQIRLERCASANYWHENLFVKVFVKLERRYVKYRR